MTKDEALKMAIEALSQDEGWFEPEKAIKACKEALEQPTVAELNDEYLRDTYVERLNQPAQEPVAWMYEWEDEKSVKLTFHPDSVAKTIPLYTHPYQWQGLTDDEINKIVKNVSDDMYPWKGNMLIGKITRAIEQALKDKNGKV